jgi:hypothetical protein
LPSIKKWNPQEQGQAYSVLLIFTNGSPADSEKALSVLKAVDGDSRNLRDCRDNYQLVKSDHVKLIEAVLDDIPDQLAAYFVGKAIEPLLKAGTEDVVVESYNERQDLSVPTQFTEAGDPVVPGDARP